MTSNSVRFFLLILLKLPKIAFGRFRDMKNDKLQSCWQKLCKKNLSALDFLSILRTIREK